MPSRASRSDPPAPSFEAGATPGRALYLLVRHLGGVLAKELAGVLEPFGVTPEQYHTLRILRDGGPDGLPCSAIAERAVSGDPDVTRLLDRLERQGWAVRARDETDRRVVIARLTAEGRRLLGRLEKAVAELHEGQFDALGAREVAALRELLGRVSRR
jgi:MarR family transcriptional regulator, organic hydroperoxide resistance regulator